MPVLWSRDGAPADAVQMNKTRPLVALGAAMMAAGAIVGFAARSEPAAAQVGPCGTENDAADASEQELHGLVNQWRAQNLGAPPMELSGPVNRAAQWFANATAAGQTSGHFDTYGRTWVGRLVDCGYSSYWANGSGESLGVGSSAAGVLAQMANPNDGESTGIEAPVAWACLGVGRSGSVWVVVVAQHQGPCPEPGPGSSPPTSTTAATGTPSTNTPTSTPTKTPTPTPTATPTPFAEFGVTITVCGGWNLLTIPVSGDVDDVFDTAVLEVAAIYMPDGESWLRWAPAVPAYARNLSHIAAGDVLWLYRPEPSCEDIDL